MRLQRTNTGTLITFDRFSELAEGGEGRIYPVPQDPSLVAKIYHEPNEEHARKLALMVAHPPEDPMATQGHVSIAWPLDLLKDQNGKIAGFLMTRVNDMSPIIDFYNPGGRRQYCPLFNWRYLHQTARNLAAAFSAVHKRGGVIADVNCRNILASERALVTLVDTDSFQVRDPQDGHVYRCPVGTAEYTPPELQGRDLSTVDRTIQHDCFGLAVIIFSILMEGTHPFAGVFLGKGDPPPYEERIRLGHFPYSEKNNVPYRPMPIAPPFGILNPSLQRLFMRCFEEGHRDPSARPDAQHWADALEEAQNCLSVCQSNHQHYYGDHLASCPWCERTRQLGGRDPFPSPAEVNHATQSMSRLRALRARAQTIAGQQKTSRSVLQRLQQTPSPVFSYSQQSTSSSSQAPFTLPVAFCFFLSAVCCLIFSGDRYFFYQSLFMLLLSVAGGAYVYIRQDPVKSFFFFLGWLGLWFVTLIAVAIISAFHGDRKKEQNTAAAHQVLYDHLRLENEHWQKREFEAARAECKQVADRIFSYDPTVRKKCASVAQTQGEQLAEEGKYQEAISSFDQVVHLDPHSTRGYVRRAEAFEKLGQHERSQRDFDRADRLMFADQFKGPAEPVDDTEISEIDTTQSTPADARKIAEFSMGMRDVKEAIASYNQAIHLAPNDPDMYVARGLAYLRLKRSTPALADFNQAIRLDPGNMEAYQARCQIELGRKQYKQVIGDCSEAIRLSSSSQPVDPSAYFNRALALQYLHRYSQAIADYDQDIQLDPGNEEAYLNDGDVHVILGQNSLALSYFDEIIDIDPKYDEAYSHRGKAYQELNKPDLAQQDYDHARQLEEEAKKN